MDDKRIRTDDRRQNATMPPLPFRDSSGRLVEQCRRHAPDRRTGGLEDEWPGEP